VETISGLVLTRQWREQADGLCLIYWIYTDRGARKLVIGQQEAVCFVGSEQAAQLADLLPGQTGFRLRQLALKSFTNVPVHAVYFRSQRLLHQVRDLCEQRGITLWEADIRTVDRYLSERFITGDLRAMVAATDSDDNPNPKLMRSDPGPLNLLCASVDIETAMDGSQLYSIAVHAFDSEQTRIKQVFMLGSPQVFADEDFAVRWFDSEADLIRRFLNWFQHLDPDIVIGWNVINFDLRFLQKRCDELKVAFTLGRGEELAEWRQARDENQHYFVLIPGRVVLDGIDTLKAATWSFESFSLETVARQLLDRGKLIHDVDNRGTAITDLFLKDKLALARYNVEDCCLVSDIFEKADLLNFAIERTRLTGLPMDKVGGSVAAFENLYLPRLHRAGYVAPNIGEVQSDIDAPGGYVMQSQPGLYEHVLVLDFKSLYPSIIRTFCIDPLALISGRFEADRSDLCANVFQRDSSAEPDVRDSDWVPGFHGAVFSKTNHLLPDIIKTLWDARDLAKRQQNAPLSQAIKIIMNSFYGVLGTPLCRFFDPLLSSSITLRGHDIMLQTRLLIEERGNKVIYGDTDSVFVWLSQARSGAEAKRSGVALSEYLNQWWTQQLNKLFGLESCLEIEFETHYRHFFMPTMRGSDAGSKKRYAGLIESIDEQQNPTEKLVFKGLEYVRTDWTPLARRVQYDVCWQVFHQQDPLPYLRQVIAGLTAGELDQELIYRKRIRRKLVDYKKNVPPHVQAARKADAWLRSNHRQARYQRGGWISYLMTLNGPEPMEHHPSALDYEHYLDRQLAPAVDGLLQCLGTSVENLMRSQLSLF